MRTDNVFQMAASNIRYGAGCSVEIRMDLRDLFVKRAMVLIDPKLKSLAIGDVVVDSLTAQHIGFEVFDEISMEA